jgi:glutathione synthase/RimK-type ligase-like ATP-grasp enzyme
MKIEKKLGTADLLFNAARSLGLQPSWLGPGGVFAINHDGTEKYINYSRSPINSHAAVSLSKDKYLTRVILNRHNLPNIPFTTAGDVETTAAFLKEHSRIVAKPIKGSGSRDIHILSDPAYLAQLDISRYIFEKYITGAEIRYLVLNGSVIAVHHSEYGTSVAEDRPLQRFSIERQDWDERLEAMTVRVSDILGLNFAAVDYLIEPSGQSHILEVNSAPGLKWFHAPTTGPPVDIAHLFLCAIVAPMPKI